MPQGTYHAVGAADQRQVAFTHWHHCRMSVKAMRTREERGMDSMWLLVTLNRYEMTEGVRDGREFKKHTDKMPWVQALLLMGYRGTSTSQFFMENFDDRAVTYHTLDETQLLQGFLAQTQAR